MPAPHVPSRRGVYSISVASELSGVGLQTLRLYERRRLIQPTRTSGGTRRYSDDDLQRIHRITELVDAGVNLPGVERILPLEDECSSLRASRTPNTTERTYDA
ncbi:MerR family transcriptional regulator [Jongsikchunia kroppenstedtii]|uniref:MerR family transcriptional regulator n=1 Tax=Jongsikchunia kroppenstedtii TaxID=1121721 RepID=UPI0005BC6BA8|nr:MerR family transcriptional regulator [Jongsikchunia kroppenstedtii]